MAVTLEIRAEVEKLARLLGVDAARLGYLEKASAKDLRALREQMTDTLFDADRELFERLAAGSRVVPDAIAATMAQKAFGPLITARITSIVPVATAVSVGRRLPTPFLADIAVQLDPRRATAVISGMPPEKIAQVSAEMARRGEWVAMGRFVGHLADDALRATTETLSDEALLRVGFVIEEPKALPRAVRMLDDDRIEGTVRAAHEHDLWPETVSLLGHLDKEGRRRILGVLAEQDDDVLTELAEAIEREGLWPAVEKLLPSAPEPGRGRLERLAGSIRGG